MRPASVALVLSTVLSTSDGGTTGGATGGATGDAVSSVIHSASLVPFVSFTTHRNVSAFAIPLDRYIILPLHYYCCEYIFLSIADDDLRFRHDRLQDLGMIGDDRLRHDNPRTPSPNLHGLPRELATHDAQLSRLACPHSREHALRRGMQRRGRVVFAQQGQAFVPTLEAKRARGELLGDEHSFVSKEKKNGPMIRCKRCASCLIVCTATGRLLPVRSYQFISGYGYVCTSCDVKFKVS